MFPVQLHYQLSGGFLLLPERRGSTSREMSGPNLEQDIDVRLQEP